jgi:hypothetical protein
MPRSGIFALAATFAAMIAAPAWGQAPATIWPEPPRQQPPTTVWPDPPQTAPPQTAPAQRRAPAQAAPAARPPRPARPAAAPDAAPAQPRRAAPRPQKPAERTQTVSCAGPFAKNATHLQLAQAFGAQNVVFTEVAGPGNTKLNASVVYPNDPKRRLEVLWHDEATRARPSAIVITGPSRWVAPHGVKLGTFMTDVEKRNGKPFKLSGFGSEGGGAVVDWDGGKLDQLGGCRMGMRFAIDSKSPEAAQSKVAAQPQFASSDPDLRAVKPKVMEIIVGYGE